MKRLNKSKLNSQLLSLIDGMGEPTDTGTSKFLEYLRKRGGTPIIPQTEIKSFAPTIKRRFPFIK